MQLLLQWRAFPELQIGAPQTIKHVAKGEWGGTRKCGPRHRFLAHDDFRLQAVIYKTALPTKIHRNKILHRWMMQILLSAVTIIHLARRNQKILELAGEPIQTVENLANAIKARGKLALQELP